jgi:hypothetical protein
MYKSGLEKFGLMLHCDFSYRNFFQFYLTEQMRYDRLPPENFL